MWLAVVLVLLIAGSGWTLAARIGSDPYATVTDTIRTKLPGETRTRVIRRVTKGKVITLPGGRQVVHVPLIVIHTDHKVIRVPAHNLPIKRASPRAHALTASVPKPSSPVFVTVYVPVVSTTTETVTVTSVALDTITQTVTVTDTLPLDPTTSDRQETP